jgi:hypothetical protein
MQLELTGRLYKRSFRYNLDLTRSTDLGETNVAQVPKVGDRLTTQNLVISAGFAEQAKTPDWASIHDLATLIDLFCLYDSVSILGRPGLGFHSRLGEVLISSGFLQTEIPDAGMARTVSETAKRHLLAYLGEEESDAYDGLLQFALSPDVCVHGLGPNPDRALEVQQGDAWLRTTPTKTDVLEQLRREAGAAPATTFVVRSFLYLAFGDSTGLVFVPDAARTSVVKHVVAVEQELRAKLLQTVSQSASPTMLLNDINYSRFSPLAAVVFERAQPDKRRIAPEMDSLRAQLAPLRARLRTAEQTILYGQGVEIPDAVHRWNAVNDELRRSFGEEPHLVSLDGFLAFGKDVGELATNPKKPSAWMKSLLGLPVDIIRRVLLRRQAVELHRLRREVPGAGRLHRSITSLFGANISK